MDRWDEESISKYIRNYNRDILVVVSSPYIAAPKEFRDTIAKLAFLSKLYIFCVNDYKLSAPGQISSLFNRRGREQNKLVWSTIPSWKKHEFDRYINWNKSTWSNDIRFLKTPMKRVTYYGSFRKGREACFNRLFPSNDEYPLVISTSARARKQFSELWPDVEITLPNKNGLLEWLSTSACSLYLEDEYSHKTYTSPANRFYECLSSGTGIIFDEACIHTFDEAGYNIRPFVARNAKEVAELFSEYKWVRKTQRKLWYRDYSEELRNDIHEAIKESIPLALKHYGTV